jgi:hypothetical protein
MSFTGTSGIGAIPSTPKINIHVARVIMTTYRKYHSATYREGVEGACFCLGQLMLTGRIRSGTFLTEYVCMKNSLLLLPRFVDSLERDDEAMANEDS